MSILEISIERGIQQGIQQKLVEQIEKKLRKGCTVEEIAEMLEESEDTIREIVKKINTLS